MELVEMSCPNCGAKITVNALHTRATCEFCGSEFLLDKGKLAQETDQRTYTEKMQEQLAEDRKQRKEAMAQETADETWETIAKGVLGAMNLGSIVRRAQYKVKRFFGLLFSLIIGAALGYLLCYFVIPSAYNSYAALAAVILTICGIVFLVSTRKTFRGFLLGLGVGMIVQLIPYLMTFVAK